jgi:uncharacterized OB-fold protein
MEAGRILPDLEDVDGAPFWAAAREKKLVVQRCDACGRLRFPPHPFCSACRSEAVSWTGVSGRGRIWSYVVQHDPTLPAYSAFTPFPVVVVELAEDRRLRMTGNVVAEPGAAINSVDPAALRIGMPVKVTFQQLAEDVTVPYWMVA